jgi:hypothetical protein
MTPQIDAEWTASYHETPDPENREVERSFAAAAMGPDAQSGHWKCRFNPMIGPLMWVLSTNPPF